MKPWEVRNQRARLAWIARGRQRSLYRMPNRRWTTPFYRLPALPPQAPETGYTGHMAPMSDDLRAMYDSLVRDALLLMGPGSFLPVIHVGDDT